MVKDKKSAPKFSRAVGRAEDIAAKRELTTRPKSPTTEAKPAKEASKKKIKQQEIIEAPPKEEEVTKKESTVAKENVIIDKKDSTKEETTKTDEKEQLTVLDTTGVRVTAYNHSRLKTMLTATKTSSFNELISLLIDYAEENYLEGLNKQIYELTMQGVDEEYEQNNWDKQLD